MQTLKEQKNQVVVLREFKREVVKTLNCLQAREKLDVLFSGDSRLEEASPPVKRDLFNHLQICQDCCRSFDVRVRFRPASRNCIY